jgi:hypothetical protein
MRLKDRKRLKWLKAFRKACRKAGIKKWFNVPPERQWKYLTKHYRKISQGPQITQQQKEVT